MTSRAIQLDGLRALAMLGICWDHWVPKEWSFGLPYEIGLYFFLVLSGYFITSSLLRIRDRSEAGGGNWRWRAWKNFQWRRGLRIIVPYYAALAVAFVFLAPRLWDKLHWYLLYLTNFHVALIGEWPPGTSHFWSIAIQQQFYLFWPIVIWLTPRRFLPLAMLLFAATTPLSRHLHHLLSPPFIWPEKISWGVFDYFGIGGLMALVIHQGFPLSSRLWSILTVFGLTTYSLLEWSSGQIRDAFMAFQSAFLAVGLCGVVGTASIGWQNLAGKFLETPFLQRVGILSYGIYLYHNLAPIVLGKIMPFLWWGPYADSFFQIALRTACFAGLTWIMTKLSWRYIETPLNRKRAVNG